MSLRALLIGCLFLQLALGCARPSVDLRGGKATPEVELRVALEDHSRSLRRIRDLQPGEVDTPRARQAALETHRATFEQHLRGMAPRHGLTFAPESPWRLQLTITSLGEVRTRYILYGIASGVAWGVGTGLVAHNTQLAIGLGTYELLEESAFWIAGASLFGSFSAPVVLEARLVPAAGGPPAWSETYYVLNARQKLKALPPEARNPRERQLEASLDRALEKLFDDLDPLLLTAPTPPPVHQAATRD